MRGRRKESDISSEFLLRNTLSAKIKSKIKILSHNVDWIIGTEFRVKESGISGDQKMFGDVVTKPNC